jgi:hypothetical protein
VEKEEWDGRGNIEHPTPNIEHRVVENEVIGESRTTTRARTITRRNRR